MYFLPSCFCRQIHQRIHLWPYILDVIFLGFQSNDKAFVKLHQDFRQCFLINLKSILLFWIFFLFPSQHIRLLPARCKPLHQTLSQNNIFHLRLFFP